MTEYRRPMKRIFHVVETIFVWAVAAVAVGMMIFTILSVTVLNRSDRSILGYRAYIVLSDSMSATDFEAGDLILVRKTDPSALQVGDIISYQSENVHSYGEVVTHKIRARTTDAAGNPAFITYGTTTETDDEELVAYSRILGKYQFRLAGVGRFLQFLKTAPGYITCIFVPFLILILIQGLNSIRLFQQYKQEQLAQMRLERKKLELERAESRRIMEELKKISAELSARNAADDKRGSS